MKLLFDARYIRTDYHDGISRYTTELANALARQTPSVIFIVSNKTQLRFLPRGSKHIMLHSVTSWREPLSALWLNRYKPDVVVSPLQTIGSVGRKFKLVLTLHDLIYYKHRTPPPQFNPAIRALWRIYYMTYIPQRITLNHADLVVTVSETSKKEIIKTKLTKRPIVVVPNAARDLVELLDEPVEQTHEKPRNLIYMGSFIPYKNVETLIRALEYIPDHTLHLLSRIRPKRQQELLDIAPPRAKIVFHNGVTDTEYAELLADTAIMVSASKAEGYGLPLAEAVAMGVPAVVTDMEIFHEVAEGGALYADPDNPSDFATKIKSLDSLKKRDALVEAGIKHIAKFNWDESAKALIKAINKL